jgi:hypothetical protein
MRWPDITHMNPGFHKNRTTKAALGIPDRGAGGVLPGLVIDRP